MTTRKELQEFFRNYDAQNKAHVRMLEMLVEGMHSSAELAELEELSGMDLSKAKPQTGGGATETADAMFDESPGYAFDASKEDAAEGADGDFGENIKRARMEGGRDGGVSASAPSHPAAPRPLERGDPGAAGSENELDFCIPGLGVLDHDNQSEMPSPKGAPSNIPPLARREKAVANKTPLETVFYKNIFVPAKTPDFTTPRDPSYLFLPLQCKLCGLRFKSSDTEPFGVHIEEHRRKTRALDDKVVLRREFFTSRTAEAPEKLNLSLSGAAEVISWDRESPSCVICGDPIKKVWRDDVEEWVLDSGARVSENEFAHRSCVL